MLPKPRHLAFFDTLETLALSSVRFVTIIGENSRHANPSPLTDIQVRGSSDDFVHRALLLTLWLRHALDLLRTGTNE